MRHGKQSQSLEYHCQYRKRTTKSSCNIIQELQVLQEKVYFESQILVHEYWIIMSFYIYIYIIYLAESIELFLQAKNIWYLDVMSIFDIQSSYQDDPLLYLNSL